jgi:lipopolysaccharide/colanic/teichoic acid biosynthesis glycosyltransferase
VDDYVLGERLFKDAFVRERKRADRFDTPLAVLLVDLGHNSSVGGGSWISILRAVTAAKRGVDAVGWLEQGAVLGLLLPEASEKRAFKVMARLRREIARRLGDKALATLSVRLYGHGVEPGPDGTTLRPVDLLLDAFVPQRKQPWRDAAKRGLDILGSIALLTLFAPVLLAVFVAVKWTSPGPALYRQIRVGRRGEPFAMLKFRSMYVNAGHGIHQDYMSQFIKSSGHQPRAGNEVFKLTNDPRITPPGRFIRKTSLDELPQFWNVLRGDMSLVGPRPPIPFEVEQYQPWHRRRVLEAKPGVTGSWQVNGRSRTTFDEMVRLDLRYARTHSLWTDIMILAATPRAMVKGAC